ncbi:hypothetical protein HMPREF9163_01263 [Selenomonas sp. oral taxon 138 str. F0429]|nr:hypothetical protein HMPREF9163_01263 [Selenomonas sp. oral taxon 138 str. F0429]
MKNEEIYVIIVIKAKMENDPQGRASRILPLRLSKTAQPAPDKE